MQPDVTATPGQAAAPVWQRWVVWTALALVIAGVFSTWSVDGSVSLNGTQGPNDGWLLAILAVLGLGWARMMERGSWVGVAGLVATAIVMCWSALADWLDSRDTVSSSAGHGLLLVLVGSVVLGATAGAHGVRLHRRT